MINIYVFIQSHSGVKRRKLSPDLKLLTHCKHLADILLGVDSVTWRILKWFYHFGLTNAARRFNTMLTVVPIFNGENLQIYTRAVNQDDFLFTVNKFTTAHIKPL